MSIKKKKLYSESLLEANYLNYNLQESPVCQTLYITKFILSYLYIILRK